jgi:hypothetical protein
VSEIIYLYISRAKDDTVAENLLIYVYPPYTFTEIKYIYLTPILHTYTSHSIRRHTLYTSSTQPIRVYAYCVDTHWHAAHYSPPTFDRPRSKRGDSSETRQRWRSSRQKKICSWATLVFNKLRIERLVHPRWSSHASARSSHGFNQQASNVLWWILTQSSFHQMNSQTRWG